MIKNLAIVIALSCGIAGLVVSLNTYSRKVVYIDMGKVYEGFDLSKELNKELEKVTSTRGKIVDSLYEALRTLKQEIKYKGKNISNDELKNAMQVEEELIYKKKKFDEENQATANQLNTKIFSQINQYVEDYGKEHKCKLILGANGQGNIMYGEEGTDITKEMLEYINNRYNDKTRK